MGFGRFLDIPLRHESSAFFLFSPSCMAYANGIYVLLKLRTDFFAANRRKLAYPTFILRAGIPQRTGERMDARVNTADDITVW